MRNSNPNVIRFGVPSLDELLYPEVFSRPAANGERERGPKTDSKATSMCIIGPDGTGKSIFALHLVSQYAADCCAAGKTGGTILYVSTDLRHKTAMQMWRNFDLGRPGARTIPWLLDDIREPEKMRTNEKLAVRLRDLSPFRATRRTNNDDEGSVARFLNREPAGKARTCVDGNPLREVGFVDLALKTGGDEWSFVNRILSALPDRAREGREAPHLVVIDAVEGFETLSGETDAYGLVSNRRSRIAQVMRSSGENCHIVFIVEAQHDDNPQHEEFVTDIVLRLRSESVDGYMRRTVSIEKARGQRHIRGRHPFVIRAGAGSATGPKQHPDDPEMPFLPLEKHYPCEQPPDTHIVGSQPDAEEKPVAPDEKRQSYIHVFQSLQYISRAAMEHRAHSSSDPGDLDNASFEIRHLDRMLVHPKTQAGKWETGFGLPRGRATAVIGEAWTRKSALGEAFLAQCYRGNADALATLLSYKTLDSIMEGIERALDRLHDPRSKIDKQIRRLGRLKRLAEVLEPPQHLTDEESDNPGQRTFRKLLLQNRWVVEKVIGEKPAPGAHSPAVRRLARAAWLLSALRVKRNDGVAVLLTSKLGPSETLGSRLLAFLKEKPPSESFAVDATVLERALANLIHAQSVCRQFEVHDITTPVFVHIVKRSVEDALARIGYAVGEDDPAKVRKAAAKIRLVIDDLRNLQDLYPCVANDPLLLPYIVDYLQDIGITSLIIHSQPGRPDVIPRDPFDRNVRASIAGHLYTWRVQFFGESRVAISAMPPFGHKTHVREYRVNRDSSLDTEKPPIEIDPHFELYRNVESGNPERAPLEVRLYQESLASNSYFERESALFDELFVAAPNRDHVLVGEGGGAYDSLRDLANLQRDTRLDRTLILAVDEFWASESARPGLARALSDRAEYLLAIVDRDGKHHDSTVDPFNVFQLSDCGDYKRKNQDKRSEFDRAYFFRRYFRGTAPETETELAEGDNVPGMHRLSGRASRELFIGNPNDALVSGYKSSRFSWLEGADVSTLETVR